MPKISTILYSFIQGVKNIKRNRMFSMASIGTMTACLFLFGIFYFVLTNFQYLLKSAETTVGITVFFKEGLTEDEISVIGSKIRTRAEVDSCRYVSAEEAWESYKEKYLNSDMAATFGDDNPLRNSASFEVHLYEVARQGAMVDYIKSIDGVRQVNNSEELAEMLGGINKAVAYVSGAIILILLSVAAFLISTTVTMGISIRKQEISIMKLIGASDFFIRAPFVVEGILIGVIGACIPLIFLYFIYYRVINFISEKFDNVFRSMTFLNVETIFSTLIPVSVGIGIGIGFLGSLLTVRKQLRKIN